MASTDLNYSKMWNDIAEKSAERYSERAFEAVDFADFGNKLREKAIFEIMPEVKGKKVLDFGCASGRQAIKIAKMGAAGVLGIDISKKYIQQAWKNSKSLENVSFQAKGNLKGLKENSFDIVLCAEVLEHVDNLEETLKEIFKVLKPEGVLIVTVPNLNSRGTLWGRVKSFFEGYKFEPIKEFNVEEVEKHGDCHVRMFDKKSISGKLEKNWFKVERIIASNVLQWPAYVSTGSKLWKFKNFRKILEKIETSLEKNKLFEGLGKNIILKAVKQK